MDETPITIAIIGGGTAGWMVAAALSHLLESGYRIQLVESAEIGTVGVGEATIPQIRTYNATLGLNEDSFVRATQATFKLGIEFVGWTAPGHRYMHGFGDVGRDSGVAFQHYWLRANAMGSARPLGHYALNEVAARAGKMHRGAPLTGTAVPTMPYAFHFDAMLYAAFLRRFSEARGTRRIEGRITGVTRDGASGDVASVTLASGETVTADLFIDCSGFRGLLIEEALGTGYDDWSRWLPCDRALAVPSERVADFTPYTRATAHAAGWQWRIPLQHRTGNGRVYCSAFTSDDEAAAGLLANLDSRPLADPRPLRFTTGKRKKAWNHNVIAMGLSGGFMEPLESTSIHLIQSAIARLVALLPGKVQAEAARREFNRQTNFEYERIRDFLILHYWANGRDEPFWQACRATALPDSLAARIDLFKATGRIFREHEELFTEVAWAQVLIGQGVTATGWHPIADQVDTADLKDYLDTVAALYAREASRMEPHADHIARTCAAAVAA